MSVSAHRGEIVGLGLFAWVIVALIFAFTARYDQSTRGTRPPTERAFLAPLGMRLFMVMMAVLMVAGLPLMLYADGAFDAQSRQRAMTAESWSLFGLSEIMGIAIGLPLFHASGPNDLFIDLDRRTYRLVRGWPYAPQVQAGSLDELAGVFVCCQSMNANYMVGIVWKNDWKLGQKWYVVLGMFNRSGRADRFAEETAEVLGLPLVAPPPHLKSASDTRGGLG